MPPNDTTSWRYTASSQEVVRSDGVLIAREVPEEFGKLVETAPALLKALEMARIRLFGHGPSTDSLYAVMRDAIFRARQ